jgi:hypothetical protein
MESNHKEEQYSFVKELRKQYLSDTRGKKSQTSDDRRRDREHRLAMDARVAAKLGRQITEREFIAANI